MDKHAHRDEFEFRVTVRRNQLVGLWAAQRLGRTDVAAEAYAIEAMFADLAEPGDDDIVQKLESDFEANGVDVTVAEIRAKLYEMAERARGEVYF